MQRFWVTWLDGHPPHQHLPYKQLDSARRFRHLRVEQLESRCLLSGVTLITHGFNSNADGWVTAMAEAIGNRADLNIDQAIYRVEVIDPGHDNGPLEVTSAKLSGLAPADANTHTPEITLVVDWSDVAGKLLFGGYTRSTYDVAAAVSDALVEPGFLADLVQPLASLPLHVMGHSRGGSLVGELARQLGLHGIWVDQATTLDPHPVDGIDELFDLDFGDAPMIAWDNVVYWDNYWRANTSSFDFNGEPIDNSHNVQLDGSILQNGGYAYDHSDVHLWYYGTIDTSEQPLANNGDEDVPNNWYGGVHPDRLASGFAYSRLIGWPRESDGLTAEISGGSASREPVAPTLPGWPNVPDIQVAAVDTTFTKGTVIPLEYYQQDGDSAATITFALDTDKNPFNSNHQDLSQVDISSSVTLQLQNTNLPTLNAQIGSYYVLATITDTGGRTRYAYAPQQIAIENATVVDRHVFYNHSTWDADAGFSAGDPVANQFDDNAIAADKQALLNGEKATFANYTSFTRGINGIMIDVAHLADPDNLSVADFEFHVGNNDDPASWPLLALAPDLVNVSVRQGAGTDGSDRVTILFPDRAVQKIWLQVTVKASAATGLEGNDVHYWGNAIGEAGNSTEDAAVNVADQLGARANPHTLLTPAPIDDIYDYNRDKQVNVQDELIARSNPSTLLTDLNLIDLRGEGGGEAASGSTGFGSGGSLSGIALPLQSTFNTPVPNATPGFSSTAGVFPTAPALPHATPGTGPVAVHHTSAAHSQPLARRQSWHDLFEEPFALAETTVSTGLDTPDIQLPWLPGMDHLLTTWHTVSTVSGRTVDIRTRSMGSHTPELSTESSTNGNGIDHDLRVGVRDEVEPWGDLARRISWGRDLRVHANTATIDEALQELLDE